MYITPIFYPESIVPQKFTFILHLNPFYYFLTTFRGALYADTSFFFGKLLWSVLFSLTALAAGWLFYNRFKDRVVYYL
jgi:ABC-type polysaccharide/polyol phosphate export permease